MMSDVSTFRSVTEQEREWDFTVYKDLMFKEIAEPEMGTEEERARICVPFPFEMNVSNNEASGDFEVHVEGWKNFVYFSPGVTFPTFWHFLTQGLTCTNGITMAPGPL